MFLYYVIAYVRFNVFHIGDQVFFIKSKYLNRNENRGFFIQSKYLNLNKIIGVNYRFYEKTVRTR